MSVRVSTDVWENATVGSTELLVLLKLADCADEEHRIAWPSVSHLAMRCRVHERTIQRALRTLELTGHISSVVAAKGATVRYRIHCTGGVAICRGVALMSPGGVAPMPPEPSLEPSIEKPPISPTPLPGTVRAVWDAYVEATGKTRAVLDMKRSALIRRQLRVFSVEDLCDAARGWQHSPWHRGDNPSGRVYNGLELLLRDAEHVEQFRDLQRGQGRKLDPTERLIEEIREARDAAK